MRAALLLHAVDGVVGVAVGSDGLSVIGIGIALVLLRVGIPPVAVCGMLRGRLAILRTLRGTRGARLLLSRAGVGLVCLSGVGLALLLRSGPPAGLSAEIGTLPSGSRMTAGPRRLRGLPGLRLADRPIALRVHPLARAHGLLGTLPRGMRTLAVVRGALLPPMRLLTRLRGPRMPRHASPRRSAPSFVWSLKSVGITETSVKNRGNVQFLAHFDSGIASR